MTQVGSLDGSARQRIRIRGGIVSLTVLFLGLMLPTSWLMAWAWYPESSWLLLAAVLVQLLLVGLAGIVPLGRGALRESFAGRSRLRWLLVAAIMVTAEYLVLRQSTPLTLQAADIPILSGWFFALTVVLVGPIIEELVYRGVMWQACMRLMGPWWSILLTSAAFTLYHGPNRFGEFPALFVGGLVLGWLRHRSGSLHPCLLSHSIFNAMTIWHP